MLEKTASIKQIIAFQRNVRDLKKLKKHDQENRLQAHCVRALDNLKNTYKGECGYVISCGPSLNRHDRTEIKSLLGNKLVFSVKQAYLEFGDISDFHICNFYNFTEIPRYHPATIVLYEYWRKRFLMFKNNHQFDEMMGMISADKSDIEHALRYHRNLYPGNISAAVTRNPASADSIYAAWQRGFCTHGPGVMYEILFPLAVHLGLKELITIGWDIGTVGSKLTHFYEDGRSSGFRTRHESRGKNVREPELIAGASRHYASWLKKNGVELKIVSDTNPADPSVPRINLKDIR